MQRQQAPFRADIVGSFLRPTHGIKQAAVSSWLRGFIDAAFSYAEIEAQRGASSGFQQQCDCGLQ